MHLVSSVTIESIGLVDVSTIKPARQAWFETCLFWTDGSHVVDGCSTEDEARVMHAKWADNLSEIAKVIHAYAKRWEDYR